MLLTQITRRWSLAAKPFQNAIKILRRKQKLKTGLHFNTACYIAFYLKKVIVNVELLSWKSFKVSIHKQICNLPYGWNGQRYLKIFSIVVLWRNKISLLQSVLERGLLNFALNVSIFSITAGRRELPVRPENRVYAIRKSCNAPSAIQKSKILQNKASLLLLFIVSWCVLAG